MDVQNRRSWKESVRPHSWPFWLVHLVAIAGIAYSGWSWTGFALAVGSYYARMFFVTGAMHRYFSHRTYKTSRAFQFVLGLGATLTVQKGVLWWAAHHRHHHRASDQEGDVHSPVQDGFWWSHIGWIVAEDHQATRWQNIKDMAKFPELRWLNRNYLVPVVGFALALQLIGGWHALLWGFFVSTTLLWHGTFTINSFSHIFGKRRYQTTDDSRNNWFLAILTMGEGWHNNHHHYQNSTNQGFFWWEIDMSYLILKGLSFTGLVWDLKKPPQHILEGRPKRQTKPSKELVPAESELPKAA